MRVGSGPAMGPLLGVLAAVLEICGCAPSTGEARGQQLDVHPIPAVTEGTEERSSPSPTNDDPWISEVDDARAILSADDARRVEAYAEELTDCFPADAQGVRRPNGMIELMFGISSAGIVSYATAVTCQLPYLVCECVLARVREWRFEPADDPLRRWIYPLFFGSWRSDDATGVAHSAGKPP